MTLSHIARAEEAVHDRASEVACRHGLDLASATHSFQTQMARTGAILLSSDNEEPNEESLEAIRETEEVLASGGGQSYGSADELFRALGL